MRIEVNLDEVPAGFEAVPAGNYQAVVSGGQVREGQEGKYIAWEFTLHGKKYEGRKLFTNTSLAPQSLWNLRRFLEACRFEWEPTGFDHEDVFGSELELVVSQSHYLDRVVNRVDSFLPVH